MEAERKSALKMLSVELVDLMVSYHYDRFGNTHFCRRDNTHTHTHILQYSILVEIAGHALTLALSYLVV